MDGCQSNESDNYIIIYVNEHSDNDDDVIVRECDCECE